MLAKKALEKRNMLVTSLFSFSHKDFYPVIKQIPSFYWSINAINLKKSKILLYGTGLSIYHTIPTFNVTKEEAF